MFGKNEIVGLKFFKAAPKDTLLITSLFLTLQGEGPYSGEPAYFIRLTKCNLACGFCDSFFDQGSEMTFDQIEEKIDSDIKKYFNNDVPNWASDIDTHTGTVKQRQLVLVITGGEPTLQSNLVPFLERMQHKFTHTQIESNGTIGSTMSALPQSTTVVVSPKCAEKNGIATKYLKPNDEMLARADCLKFVMSADVDSPYYEIPDWAHSWKSFNNKDIFVSPMNIYNRLPQKAKQLRTEKDDISIEERSTVDEIIDFWEEGLLDPISNEKNHKYTAKYCLFHGFVLNLQQHLYAGLP